MNPALANPMLPMLPMTASVAEQVVFWLLSALTVFFACFTMTRRNPVTAVMSLVATFFCLAGLYATLSAHFLAIIQILVYAGAIMVLFIFVVMILNREEVSPVVVRPVRLVALLAAVYLLVKFVHVADTGVAPAVSVPESFGTVANIGDLLFRDFLWPFEAISLLLLVAIVGGVVVSRSQRKEIDATVAAAARKESHDRQLADYPQPADALEEPDASHGGGH
jgi:NADH-quinone oxidoreductase subunit J